MKRYLFTPFPRNIFMRPWKVQVPIPYLITGSISALIVSFYFGGLLAPHTGMINALLISSAAAIVLFLLTAAVSMPLGDVCAKVGLRKVGFREFLLCVGALLIILAGSAFLTAFWQQILEYFKVPFEKEQALLQLVRGSDLATLLKLLLLTAGLVPVLEELVFRRALYSILLKLGAPVALVGTSVIFGAAHGFLLGFPGLCFMGLTFQCVANRTRNLWCSIILHAMLNATVLLVTFWASKMEG